MRPSERPEIRDLPLFRTMRDDSFDTLAKDFFARDFPPGFELLRQGDPARVLHIVLDGAVLLYTRHRGRETTTAVVEPTGSFILAACIRDAPYLVSARTLERARVVLVPCEQLRAIVRQDPDFALAVAEELSGCIRQVVRHTKNLKLRNAQERLAAYLLRESRLCGDADRFILPVEMRTLASFLGMMPETLSRSMRSLEAAGIAKEGARAIRITDRDALARLAAPDALIDGPGPVGTSRGIDLPGVRAAS